MGKYDADQSTGSQNGRIIFKTDNIDKFMRSHGANVSWEKAVLSPNRTEDGQQRQTESGNGLIYLKPKRTWALLQGMNRNAMNSLVGLTTVGTALLTTRREDKMAVRDRIGFDDQSIPEKLLIKVNPKDITSGVNLRYKVKEIETALVPQSDGTFDYVDPSTLNIDWGKSIFYPTEDMIGKYVSLNIIAELRFYVVNIIREGRFQYENDVAQQKENRDMTELPRLLAVRREDMYIPDILGVDNSTVSVTGEELDPRPEVDYEMQGFFDR